jgi:hypothetical protein
MFVEARGVIEHHACLAEPGREAYLKLPDVPESPLILMLVQVENGVLEVFSKRPSLQLSFHAPGPDIRLFGIVYGGHDSRGRQVISDHRALVPA